MTLLSIGEAARMLGLNTSALRYYEARGLLKPSARRSGRRLYAPKELRRLAFIEIMRRIGVGLDTVAAVLNGSGEQWRTAVAEQIASFDDLIEQMTMARGYLGHILACPEERPVDQCPKMIAILDQRLNGADEKELTKTVRFIIETRSCPR
jgi:MerR family copper efflux transcriptional regulator